MTIDELTKETTKELYIDCKAVYKLKMHNRKIVHLFILMKLLIKN